MIALDNSDVNENAAGATIGFLTTDDDNTIDGDFDYEIVADMAGTAVVSTKFQIDDATGELKLKDGETLDYEGGSPVPVFVKSIDEGGKFVIQKFDITVNDKNDAPVFEHTGPVLGLEGAAITLTFDDIGVSDEDATDGDTELTYTVSNIESGTITVGGVVQTTFTLADVKANLVQYVHNGAGSGTGFFDIVAVDDEGASTGTQKIAVTLTDVNEAPVVTDPIDDQAGLSGVAFSFSIPGGTFTDFDGDFLTLSTGALPAWLSFNATSGTFTGTPPTAGPVSVTVFATDTSGASVSDTFNIAVTDAANPLVLLSDDSVAENSAAGVEVGALSGVDGNGVALTFALGNTDPDNASFAIVDGKLVVADGADLDFETKSSYEITVTATEGDGSTFDASLTINLEDVAENPKGTKKNDKLEGDAMDNVLNGKKGNDKLIGGDGADTFMFSKGKDKILDFDGAEGDMIDMSKAKGIKDFDDMIDNHVTDTASGLKIVDNQGNSMFIKGADIDDLTADMFMF
ncbi:MAG: putative Ig domain-containing protein [Rhizobium sp.]|nr:putative Ig domain-containing protein [Rhizobium sp.]